MRSRNGGYCLLLNTLYGKLTAVLLSLICLMGLLYILVTLFTIRMYVREVIQELNRPLATTLVAQHLPIRDGRINQAALHNMFGALMMINPSIELYLLDLQGKILAHTVPAEAVQRERIALEPLRQFINGNPALPLFADDPRYHGRQKIFSVSPIPLDGPPQGYLYVILMGEELISVARMLQSSYVVRLSTWALLAVLALALLVGAFFFHRLTRRLRRLTTAVESFQQGDFSHPLPMASRALHVSRSTRKADEIDRLAATFTAMADRIQHQIQALQQVDLQRRELVANVSHDLRTPLTALRGYLETLLLQDPSLSAREQEQYLDIALRNSERLEALIADLFELAKLDSHEVRINIEAFSLSDLVEDVLQKWRLMAEQKRLTLNAIFNDPLPFVLGDIGLIERVLDNLLQNALRYTPSAGRVEVLLEPAPTTLVVRVSDTGSGIAPADLSAIFERFYRADPERHESPRGTGLGLAIVKRILDLHGSRIEVESTPSVGSTFSFALPISPDSRPSP